jgi:hypothetical protein
MMPISKIKILSLTLAVSSGLSLAVFAEDTNKATAADAPIVVSPPAGAATNAAKAARPKTAKQADVASTNATFGTVAVTDAAYKSAVDAHALEDALKLVDSEGAFKGKVAKIYERGLAIVEFDDDYKTALTAIVRPANFDKFPALTNLIGKNVLITGKFIKYKEAAQIVVEKPEQIKIVEEAKESK